MGVMMLSDKLKHELLQLYREEGTYDPTEIGLFPSRETIDYAFTLLKKIFQRAEECNKIIEEPIPSSNEAGCISLRWDKLTIEFFIHQQVPLFYCLYTPTENPRYWVELESSGFSKDVQKLIDTYIDTLPDRNKA